MPFSEPITFFIDDALGAKALSSRLRGLGEDARVLLEEVGKGTLSEALITRRDERDAVWIPRVASLGWVILTCDKAMRRRALERQAIIDHGGAAFFLTGTKLNGAQIADVFEQALPGIRRACWKYSRPLIATVTRGADVKLDVGERRGGVRRA